MSIKLTHIILLTCVSAVMSGANNLNIADGYSSGTAFTRLSNFRVNQAVSTKAYVSRVNFMRIQQAKKTAIFMKFLEENKPLVYMLNYYGYRVVYRWPESFNNHRISNLRECVSLTRYCQKKN